MQDPVLKKKNIYIYMKGKPYIANYSTMGTPIDHQLPCWGHAFMAPAVWIQLDAQLSSYPPAQQVGPGTPGQFRSAERVQQRLGAGHLGLHGPQELNPQSKS